MSEPIKVGDLVIVLRTCCQKAADEVRIFGGPFKVDSFLVTTKSCHCGYKARHKFAVFDKRVDGSLVGAPVTWCKRIPPLSELDDVKKDEEITA